MSLPTGNVAFLFTDIEDSTLLWERRPEAMRAAVARHDALAAALIERHHGHRIKSRGEGDSLFAVFARAADALACACALQRAFVAEAWPTEAPLRVRMALHTGEAELREGDYYGPAVNRCARLRAAAHGGQVLLSQAARAAVGDGLPEGAHLQDLGEHGLKDLVWPEQIFHLRHPDLPAEFPPLRTLDAYPNNLPAQPTPLLGRERELQGARTLLGTDSVRLLTLTGPGGTGKTRLALQVAADMTDAFPDGVYFVPLAPITEADLVVAVIAQTLGLRAAGNQPLAEILKNYLRDKRVLLVLDNFEQVLAAAPMVADLLADNSPLKVIVTSRAVLHLPGVRQFPVPPLRPDAAAALFLERAITVRPDFTLTDENAAVVAEICRRLDGLPLAIELAAARVKLLSPESLLARLESRLALLTGGPSDLPERQRTLRATIAWSYDLLSEPEKTLFGQLSVFAGGCTPEAAEAVCRAGEDGAIAAREGLDSLTDKSLLRREEPPGGEPRFAMLETIREFASECLRASGEGEAIGRRHAQFFLALAEAAEPGLRSPEQALWRERLGAEQDNLRAALRSSPEEPEGAEICLRLAAALRFFWVICAQLTEGRMWLEAALCKDPGGQARLRAKALNGLGFLAFVQRNLPQMIEACQESLRLARQAGDDHETALALALTAFSFFLRGRGNPDRESLHRAAELCRESRALALRIGDTWTLSFSSNILGFMALRRGDYERAAALLREALPLSRLAGDKQSVAYVLANLGEAELGLGRCDEAKNTFVECLDIFRDAGHKPGFPQPLTGLANVARAQGHIEKAARLFGAAEALRDALGIPVEPFRRADYDRDVAALRGALGPETFAAAWAAGRAMPLEDALTYARENDEEN